MPRSLILPSGAPGWWSSPGPAASAFSSAAAGASAAVKKRLVVVFEDQKCPMFNGRTGMGMAMMVWIEQNAPGGIMPMPLLRDQLIEPGPWQFASSRNEATGPLPTLHLSVRVAA